MANKSKTAKTFEALGNKYGKPDVERLGLFSEMPYMNGQGYVSPFPKNRLVKGKNLLAGGRKEKTGWQDCYFDKNYKRLFTGEALKGRGYKPKPSAFKNVSERPMIPPGLPKWHSSPGDWYGTFQGRVEAFGNKLRPKPPFKHEGPNALTSPGKKGGPGYTNICLNPFPTHSIEKYGVKPKYKQFGQILDGAMVIGMHSKAYFENNPFKDPDTFKPGPTYVPPHDKEIPPLPPGKFIPTGPAKEPGGCKAGCFNKFPQYSAEKYRTAHDIQKPPKSNPKFGNFYPPSFGEKTLNTCSVVNENVRFRVNEENYKTYEPTFVKYLID